MSDLNEPGGKFGADPDTRRLVIAAKFGRPGAEADLRHRLQRHRGPARGRNRQILDRREAAARVFGQEHADRNLAVRQREFGGVLVDVAQRRSEEHTSELQSLMRISYAVFCLKKTNTKNTKLATTIST